MMTTLELKFVSSKLMRITAGEIYSQLLFLFVQLFAAIIETFRKNQTM